VGAAKQGRKEVVQLLLDRGADVNLTSTYGDTPLVEAAKQGRKEVVQLLLDRGADVNLTPKYGDTPLVGAAKQGRKEVVQLLLDRGANMNLTSTFGDTPLVEAAKQGHKGVVQLLLDRGADVNLAFGCKNTPLVEATKQGHKGVVRLLLDRGAGIDRFSYFHLRRTALAEAADKGDESMVQLLLNRGANKNTGLFSSAWAGDVVGTWTLLRLGADKNFALVGAAMSGRKPAVLELLKDGADPNVITPHGTALSAAASARWHEHVINLLLQEGADVQTAVCLLQGDGHTASARRLLRSISRPRDSVATVLELQNLRLHFVHQYTLMINVGQGSSTKCRSLAQSFRNYRDAWAAGTSAMRGLCLGGRPETFHDTMSFLCLARAIVETLGNSGHGDYLEHFLLDLNRWQELFRSNAEEFDAYREAVYSMWGVLLDQTEVVYEDALISFQQLASTLIHHAKESLDLDVFGNEGLEPSQRRWLERTSQILSTNDQAANAEGERSYGVDNTQQLEPGPLWDLDPPPPTIIVPLKERIKNDASSPVVEPMVILLMAGAVFAIVIVFLQGLSTTSLFYKS
jgi:ankyrin repeat protein